MATINFLYRSKKEKASLILRLLFRHNGKDFVLGAKTKYLIEKKYWEKKHFTNTKDANVKNKQIDVNTDLLKIENHILDAFNDLEDLTQINKDWLIKQLDFYYNPPLKKKQSEFVTDNIQIIIDTAHTRENGKKGIGLSLCRINAYKRLKTLFNEYQRGINYKVKELDKSKFEDFKIWLLDDKLYSQTYSLKKLSDLKTVCKEARSKGVEAYSQLNDIKVKQVSAYDDDMDVIILTSTEIEKIEKAELPTKALINARKWLILACFTGQRGQALTTRIKTDNFEQYGNELIIKIRQKKGNKAVIIPVLPKVKDIYENGMPYIVSTQKLNKHFKEIGKIAKIDDMIMGRIIEASENKGEKRKRGIKKLRPKYDYISTHIGRRTFASNHYGKIPTPIIMRVTGHSKESTFLTYINQTDNSHIDTFLDYYKAKEKTENKVKMKVVNKKVN